MEATGPAFGMTDLEERLQGPEGSRIKDELLSRLSQLRAELDAMVELGLRPEQFACATAIRAAIDAACAIMVGIR